MYKALYKCSVLLYYYYWFYCRLLKSYNKKKNSNHCENESEGERELNKRAVYTCIKNPESFVHSSFSWEVARQVPLNTAKNPNRKTHLRSRIFWNSAGFSGVFANVNACSNLAGYYSGFWSHGTWPSAESPDRDPRRNAHYTCTVKGREKSRMRTTYQNNSMRFGFFSRMCFSCQKPQMLWVFLAV